MGPRRRASPADPRDGIGPLSAIAFAPGPVAKLEGAAGRLWVTSTKRQVAAIVVDGEIDLVGEPLPIASIFSSFRAQLADSKVAVQVKMEAVAALATLAEDEARELLDLALASGPTEVRVAAAAAMVRSYRRASRPALRAALSGNPPEVRIAAFDALVALERDQPLAAVRAGLACPHEDVRVRAVAALVPVAPTSVIAQGMIADALRHENPNVRIGAYAALRRTAPTPLDAVRTALSRGGADIRARALIELAFGLGANDATARQLAAGAFDDDDANVRAAAFMAAIAMRPALAGRLYATVSTVKTFWERIAGELSTMIPPPADSGRTLDDDELQPVFAQLACRHADAAIRGSGCLLALGDPRAVGAVLQLTREADPTLRRNATANLVLAVRRWPDDDRLAARLSWLLDDDDAEVRASAFTAVAAIASTTGPAAELELATTAMRASQEDIRVRALQILVRIGAPAAPSPAIRPTRCSATRSTTKRRRYAARRSEPCGRGTPRIRSGRSHAGRRAATPICASRSSTRSRGGGRRGRPRPRWNNCRSRWYRIRWGSSASARTPTSRPRAMARMSSYRPRCTSRR